MAKSETLGIVFGRRRQGSGTSLQFIWMQEQLLSGKTIFMPTLNESSLRSLSQRINYYLKCRVQVVYDDHSGDRLILDYDQWGEPLGINWEKSRPAPSISGLRLLPFNLAEELKDNEYYLGIKVV